MTRPNRETAHHSGADGRSQRRAHSGLIAPVVLALLLLPLLATLVPRALAARSLLQGSARTTSLRIVKANLSETDVSTMILPLPSSQDWDLVPADPSLLSSPPPRRLDQPSSEPRSPGALTLGLAQGKPPYEAVLLDEGGSPLRLSATEDYERRSGRGRLNASGSRFAAWMQRRSTYLIGEFDLSSGRFQIAHSVPRGPDSARPPCLFWRGDTVVFSCETLTPDHRCQNLVLEIDLTTHRLRTLLQEEHWDPNRSSLGHLALSPDGRWLAFDRFRRPSEAAGAPACAGLYLLDLESGRCEELTRECRTGYRHLLAGWESPHTLLFWRTRGRAAPTENVLGARYDLCRVSLSP